MREYHFVDKAKNSVVVSCDGNAVVISQNGSVSEAEEFANELVASSYVHFMCTLLRSKGMKRFDE